MNVTVVSGLAEGVDSYAYTDGALDAGGRTIAVIGRWFKSIYFHLKIVELAEKIVQSGAY